MEKILISACLVGEKTRYDGKSNYNPLVKELLKYYELVPVCPEVLGGLSIPRIPSERKGDNVFNNEGKDVTNYFNKGSKEVLNIVKYLKIKRAILKENSPSCGVHSIYDGYFRHKFIHGSGVLTDNLKALGIICYNEDEIQELINEKNKDIKDH